MKKHFLLVCSVAILSLGFANAQSYSPWSVQLKGGINTIRGLSYGSAWDRDFNPEYGAAIEYSMSPIIGVGLEYLYQNNDHSKFAFSSEVNQATFFTSLNLSNLALKYRTGFWKKFNTYLNTGAGFGFGSYKDDFGLTDDVTNLAASFGLNLEYNISRYLAIGLEGQYRWNSNGYYNPPVASMIKDFYTGNLNMRIKLPCKAKTHIRNVSISQYEGMYAGVQQLTMQSAAVVEAQTTVETEVSAVEVVEEVPVATTVGEAPAAPVLEVAEPVLAVAPIVSEVEMSDAQEEIFPAQDIDTNVSMRTESYVNSSLKRYSVVVGSYMSKANADAFAMKLRNKGNDVSIVQNEQGMHRVVLFTSNSVAATIAQAKSIRSSFPDAWVLILK